MICTSLVCEFVDNANCSVSICFCTKRFLASEAVHLLGFVVFKKFVVSYLVNLYIQILLDPFPRSNRSLEANTAPCVVVKISSVRVLLIFTSHHISPHHPTHISHLTPTTSLTSHITHLTHHMSPHHTSNLATSLTSHISHHKSHTSDISLTSHISPHRSLLTSLTSLTPHNTSHRFTRVTHHTSLTTHIISSPITSPSTHITSPITHITHISHHSPHT